VQALRESRDGFCTARHTRFINSHQDDGFQGTSAVQFQDGLQRSATLVRRVSLGLLLGWFSGGDSRTGAGRPAHDPAHSGAGPARALDQYSHATGVAVLVDSQLSRGRRSLAVDGEYTAADALRRLLGGSGLMARYARDDAFTLQVAQVETCRRPWKTTPASAAVGAATPPPCKRRSSATCAVRR
jgi:hypothetical protein